MQGIPLPQLIDGWGVDNRKRLAAEDAVGSFEHLEFSTTLRGRSTHPGMQYGRCAVASMRNRAAETHDPDVGPQHNEMLAVFQIAVHESS
jgi:hypothetical protein